MQTGPRVVSRGSKSLEGMKTEMWEMDCLYDFVKELRRGSDLR